MPTSTTSTSHKSYSWVRRHISTLPSNISSSLFRYEMGYRCELPWYQFPAMLTKHEVFVATFCSSGYHYKSDVWSYPNIVVKWVTLLLCIWENPESYLARGWLYWQVFMVSLSPAKQMLT
jgi:hypothetical protein